MTVEIPSPTTLTEAFNLIPAAKGERTLAKLADKVQREFHCISDADDLVSEFWIWLGNHPTHAKQWFYIQSDVLCFGWMSFQRDAKRVMARFAREEKEQALGLKAEDNAVYPRSQIKELLQYVWHDPSLIAEAGPEVRTSSTNDPAKGGGKLAAIVDVQNAYATVIHEGSRWDTVLKMIYAHGAPQTEVASVLGITQQAVSKTHAGALDALSQHLNGTESWHEGPGTRDVMTNAQALRSVDQ